MLLGNHPQALQELFSLKLNALGICEMEHLAFLLGNELDAEKVAQEIFGTDNNAEVQLALLQLWAAAEEPGRAILSLKMKRAPATVDVIPNVLPAPLHVVPL